jgi:atypical dual specificity phosphatase
MSFEQSINWVSDRILCFGPKPGRWSTLEEDLDHLKTLGVKGILSLVEREPSLKAYEAAGFQALHVPVDDYSAPTMDQISNCIHYISEQAPVYVHCYAGYGRAGTIAAAWLIKNGMSPVEAVRTIRKLRPGAIEVDAQFDALLKFGASL